MLEFKQIELSDKEWIDKLLSYRGYQGSEYTYTTNFIWGRNYNIQVARMDNYFLSRGGLESPRFVFPSGEGDIKPVIRALEEYSDRLGIPLTLHSVNDETKSILETVFPGEFEIREERRAFDYIYKTEKMINLGGKKLHAKRNYINGFKRDYEGRWSFEPITADNLPECLIMNEKWCEQNNCMDDHKKKTEICAVKRALISFFELGLVGGMLKIDGKAVGYSAGSRLNHNTFIVHIEKAFAEIRGAYPMLANQFAKHACGEYEYINREDDADSENLRKAKLSYYPEYLLTKYTARKV